MKTIKAITWQKGIWPPFSCPDCMFKGCEEVATHYVQIRGELDLNLCLCERHAELSESELVTVVLNKEG